MSHVGYHEPYEMLSQNTRDMHRALRSLEEELEAIDWYRQRADVTEDGPLREVLLHNMREEIEHAAMVLEWIRRSDSDFDQQLRTYLFAEGDIAKIEEEAEGEGKADEEASTRSTETRPWLTIGTMKGDGRV
nr:encapsulin-associated ferritin-like protein [Thiohalomonas denitrificans]